MPAELTVKQKKLVKGVAAGKSKKQAAIDAGYSPKSAPQLADETLKIPNVRAAFLKAMDKAGITDEKLVKVLRQGLDAKNEIIVGGRTVASRPDHDARHKFLKTAVDIKGLEAAKDINVRNTTLEDLLGMDDGSTDSTTEGIGAEGTD